jgi:GMP synthase-like glutamine amidotransferase
MTFKALLHKTLPDTFGVFVSVDKDGVEEADTEIFQSPSPQLLGICTDMEFFRKYYQGTTAIEQLNDYDVVTIELRVIN